jgi:hypothetical protein
MSTVPIFAPDGTLGDIPADRLAAAVKQGAKPGIHITAPDGSSGVVPADRIQEATKAGAKIVPLSDQPEGIPEYYGFTPKNVARNAWEGFKGTIASVGAVAKDLAANPNWAFGENSTLQKFVAEPMHQEAARAVDAFNKGEYTAAFGHAVASGVPVVGPVAAQIGEQAGTGDVGGAAGQVAGMAGAAKVMQTGTRLTGRALAAAPDVIEHARNITPKQAAQLAGGVGGGVAGHGTLSAPGAYYGARTAGGVAEVLLGKERANAPIFDRGDATGTNIPYAGEETPQPLPPTPNLGLARIVRKSERPLGPIKGNMNATTAQQAEALRSIPAASDVVDQHLPPTEANHAENLRTKAEVEFHLRRGDVAGAEAALDEGAKRANPAYEPPARGESAIDFETRRAEMKTPTQIKGVESKIPTPEQEKAVMQASDYRAAVKKAMEKGEEPPSREQFAEQPDLKETARRLIEEQQAKEPPQTAGTVQGAARDTKLFQQAKAELGEGASISDIAKRAQELKMTPPEFMQRETRQIVPSVQNIRENIAMQKAAEASQGPRRFDLMEDKGIIERMRQDLEEHGSRTEEEAKREFIARNSTGITKGQLTGQTPVEQGDLTSEWQKALDDIRKRKAEEE